MRPLFVKRTFWPAQRHVRNVAVSRWRGPAIKAWILTLGALALAVPAPIVQAATLLAESPAARQEAERLNQLPPVGPTHGVHVDHSGRRETGRASYYARHFSNRKMADGRRMNPNSNVAASKTLPLGSVAKVTNLDNGKTATVRIEDRGPYVDGRVVDLAPKVADQLDVKKKGVAPVEVAPITVAEPDGKVKLGAGAADASASEVQAAVAVTKDLTRPTAEAER